MVGITGAKLGWCGRGKNYWQMVSANGTGAMAAAEFARENQMLRWSLNAASLSSVSDHSEILGGLVRGG